MNKLLQIAFTQQGQKEIVGPKHNATIVNYAKEIGLDWVNDDETPWCAIFTNWVAKMAGLEGTNSALARSFMSAGSPVTDPEPGDVVVFWRGSVTGTKGHVGFFLGFNKSGTRAFVLGGNQGNQVSIAKYRTDQVLGYRRLSTAEQLDELPEPPLRHGDDSNAVGALQRNLNKIGFPCGRVDNDFGGKTEHAVKVAQRSGGLPVTGVYDGPLRDHLQSLLQR